MKQRLAIIERRYAAEAREDRAVTLLRSLAIPHAAWPEPYPENAVLAVHRDAMLRIVGTSFKPAAIPATLGRDREWTGYGALIPELKNAYDEHAVGVWAKGRQLGYLPADAAAQVHGDLIRLLDRGTAVAVRLIVFRTDRGMGGRVKLAIPLATRVA
jgi:hypothetical protein